MITFIEHVRFQEHVNIRVIILLVRVNKLKRILSGGTVFAVFRESQSILWLLQSKK